MAKTRPKPDDPKLYLSEMYDWGQTPALVKQKNESAKRIVAKLKQRKPKS